MIGEHKTISQPQIRYLVVYVYNYARELHREYRAARPRIMPDVGSRMLIRKHPLSSVVTFIVFLPEFLQMKSYKHMIVCLPHNVKILVTVLRLTALRVGFAYCIRLISGDADVYVVTYIFR